MVYFRVVSSESEVTEFRLTSNVPITVQIVYGVSVITITGRLFFTFYKAYNCIELRTTSMKESRSSLTKLFPLFLFYGFDFHVFFFFNSNHEILNTAQPASNSL